MSVCSLNAGAVSNRPSPPATAGAAVVMKSDPTQLPTEFSRPVSAPPSKVRHCDLEQSTINMAIDH